MNRFLLLTICILLSSIGFAQTLYSGISGSAGWQHDSSNPPAAGPQSDGATNFTLSYQVTPTTDGSTNWFDTSSGNGLSSSDWGGEARMETVIIDVSGADEVRIDGVGSTVGTSVFNNLPTEYFEWFYILDSDPEQNFGFTTSDGSLDASQTVDVTGVDDLIVGFNFNINGGGDGFEDMDITVEQTVTAPVELSSFKAVDKNGMAELSWTTASEINNSHFDVQRSIDGRSFETIGVVKGMGTTNVAQSYSFASEIAEGMSNYYRLKQVDYDGAFELSNVLVLKSKDSKDTSFDVFLNGASELNVFGAVDSEYIIRDQQGRTLLSGHLTGYDNIDISALNQGVHFISVMDQSGFETKRFYK